MRRALNGARTLAGVPPRLSPKGIIPSQRLSFRPGFLGRGLNGRYPPSPVPVQGSTSRPGRNAGGLIPKPPGNGVQDHPRAPHPLHLSACLRKASFGERDMFLISQTVTYVNKKATLSKASPARGRLAARSAAGGEVGARWGSRSVLGTSPPDRQGGRTLPLAGEGGTRRARNARHSQELPDHAYNHHHDDCRRRIGRRPRICAASRCGARMPPSVRPSRLLPIHLRRRRPRFYGQRREGFLSSPRPTGRFLRPLEFLGR